MDIDVSSGARTRRVSFFVGPLLGVSLIALAATIGVGPGAALLSLLGAFVLIVLAPVLQFALLKTQKYKERPLAVCIVVIFASIAMLFIAALTGLFSFW
ncbi:MAG: hypothetical protein JSR66_13140 [Proteobacteria bacterium]|nr:hypothetical protein [Pseudomonadota bacterium]